MERRPHVSAPRPLDPLAQSQSGSFQQAPNRHQEEPPRTRGWLEQWQTPLFVLHVTLLFFILLLLLRVYVRRGWRRLAQLAGGKKE
jgi:hypothetical protein